MQKGFTLIEMIVYIALLSIIMIGAVTVSYQLIQGTGTSDSKATVQEEGNFLSRKMEWAFNGMTNIALGGSGPCNFSATITRYENPTIVVFQRNSASSTLEFRENGGIPVPITSSNVAVDCLIFSALSNPTGISATTTIRNINITTGTSSVFAITKYKRQ
jgi:prepilin-type N-terminal cleavage/methylation domain-containing protein